MCKILFTAFIGRCFSKRTSLLLLIAIHSFLFANTQSFVSKWQAGLIGDHADNVVDLLVLPNNQYLFAANSHSKISGNKTSTWFGETDIVVFVLDEAGNKVWEKSYGGERQDRVNSCIKISTGGFLLIGESNSKPSGNKTSPNYENSTMNDMWIIKIDDNGNIVWEKTFGGVDRDDATDGIETSDGGFIITGNSATFAGITKNSVNYGSLDFWTIKIDANGNKLWDKSYGGKEIDWSTGIAKTQDGNYIITGTSQSNSGSGNKTAPKIGESDTWLIKISPEGTLLLDKTYGTIDNDYNYKITTLKDGNFLIYGREEGIQSAFIRKIDQDLNTIWYTTCKAAGFETYHSIDEAADGTLYASGSSFASGEGCKTSLSFGNYDMWGIHFDQAGNKLEEFVFGGSQSDIANKIKYLDGGDILLAGSTQSPNNGNKTTPLYPGTVDGWIVRCSKKLFINKKTPSAICSGTQFKTHFTTNGMYNPDNEFFVQISDNTGAFMPGQDLGTIAKVETDSILATLPPTLFAGTGYQLRVISTSPRDTSGIYPVQILGVPKINLGNDTIICRGTSLKLEADIVNSSFLWQDGTTTNSVHAVKEGWYWCEVNNGCTIYRDSIHVDIKELPSIYLGKDTSFCSGNSIMLKPTLMAPDITYKWSNGSSQSSTTISQGGEYWLTVTNSCGSIADTILTIQKPLPNVDLGKDTGFCYNSNILLSSKYPINGTFWNWSTGERTASISISSIGTYWLQGTLDGCNASDTINIQMYQLPTVTILPSHEISICKNASVILTGSGSSIYSWSDGQNGSSVSVKDSGWIVMHGEDIRGCSNYDSAHITWVNREAIHVSNDTVLCNGAQVELFASGGEKFSWSPSNIFNDATLRVPTASPTKTTKATVTIKQDSTGCNTGKSATIVLTVLPPVKASAGTDTIVSIGDRVTLTASGGITYQWSSDVPLSNPNSSQIEVQVDHDMSISVKVEDAFGCTGYDTKNIRALTGPEIYVPSAFSPNGDFLNDVFKPILAGFKSLKYFRVYNRYGELIYQTNEVQKGWDGKVKGVVQKSDVFVWTISAEQKNGQVITKKGSVVLMR